MIIGLNGQKLLIDNPAGPEKYTYHLINALAKIEESNKYVVYFDKDPTKNYFETLTNSNPNFSYKVVKEFISWTQVSLALELITNPIDLFFSSVHTLPVIRNPKMKTVGMIHGLEYKYSPGFNNPIKRLIMHRPEWYVCAFSDSIIVPSQATKDAILSGKWLGVKENRISIISEGVDARFSKKSEPDTKAALIKYNLNDFRYLIFVSTIQPRKNIPAMIHGFSLAKKENKDLADLKLVIIGKKGWNFEESYLAPKKYNVQDQVKFLGRVPDEDLPQLYSGASGYINVSLEEGFGLPLLEALACELPCVVSDISAHRELGKEIPFYVNPSDPQDIKKGILELFSAQDVENRILDGKYLAESYSWEDTAWKTVEVFQKLIT